MPETFHTGDRVRLMVADNPIAELGTTGRVKAVHQFNATDAEIEVRWESGAVSRFTLAEARACLVVTLPRKEATRAT